MLKNFFNFKFGKEKITKRSTATLRHKNFLAGTNSDETFSWTNTKLSADEIVQKWQQTLVARSCEQFMNNPYAKRFGYMLQNNVIGMNGITLQAKAKDTNGKLDKVANDAIEKAWGDWGKICDVSGKLNWLAIQNLLILTIAREGEAIVRAVKGKNINNWGFGVQLIDPKRLDFNKCGNNPSNGNMIKFGIEFDEFDRPVTYYISKGSSLSDGHYEIPADEIYHLFVTEFTGQKRGLPWASTSLMRMNMLTGFEQAAVENARAGACQMGIIKNNDPDAQVDPEETIDLYIDAKPASMVELPPGYDLEKYDPTYPTNEFDPFTKAILRGIASGLNVNYNTLANDLTSVNFSSLRQGALDERDTWMCLQEWLKSVFHEPLCFEWLKYSLLAKKIQVGENGFLPAEKISKYKDVNFIGRRWAWVDPVKDVNSSTLSVKAGFRSRSDVIREQGRDPEDVWEEIEKENEYLESKNILVKDEVIKDVGDE